MGFENKPSDLFHGMIYVGGWGNSTMELHGWVEISCIFLLVESRTTTYGRRRDESVDQPPLHRQPFEQLSDSDTLLSTMATAISTPNATIYVANIDWKIKKPLLKRALYSLFSRHGKVCLACRFLLPVRLEICRFGGTNPAYLVSSALISAHFRNVPV